MTIFNYKDLSKAEQIKVFYAILECGIYNDYDNEIDQKYMNIIIDEIWNLYHVEDQMYDFEYLTLQTDNNPPDYVYSEKELGELYEALIAFRAGLFKKYNIEYQPRPCI